MFAIKRLGLFFLILLIYRTDCFSLDDSKTKIGVILPLSGSVSIVGEALRNSLLLSKELGKFEKIEFKFEDDQYTPRNSLSAVKKLVEVDGINGLIVFGSGPSLAISDYVEQRSIPTFAMAYTDDLIKDRRYIYRTFLTASSQAKVIKEELLKRHYTSLGVITSTSEAMVKMREAVDKIMPIKPIVDIQLDPSDLDLKFISAKIIQKNPQALFFLVLPPHISMLSQSLRSKHYTGTFFSSSQLNNPSEIAASKGSLKGAWLVTIDDTTAYDFHRQYEDRYSNFPFVDGAIAVDVATLLVSALQEKDFNNYLDSKNSYDGIYGVWKKTSSHTFEPPLRIKVIQE